MQTLVREMEVAKHTTLKLKTSGLQAGVLERTNLQVEKPILA